MLSSFTGNTIEQNLNLVVLRIPPNPRNIWTDFKTPLNAITAAAWFLIILLVFYMAMVLSSIWELYDGKHNPGISRSSRLGTCVAHSVYDGVLSLTSGVSHNDTLYI